MDPDTYCLDAKLIEKAITPKTKVILPVHLGMRFADMDEILRIAQKHNLKVIEDCAHAHGGMWKGKGAGSMGDLGAFSFQSSKLITSGEGGAVITNNLEYMELVQSYINAGRASLTDQFHHRIIGFNYRLGEFQAAVLGPQLERLPQQAAIREKNMKHFESRLQNTPGIGLSETRSAYHASGTLWLRDQIFRGQGERYSASGVRGGTAIGRHSVRWPVLRAGLQEFAIPSGRGRFPGSQLGPRKSRWTFEICTLVPESDRAAYHEAVWFPHQHFLGSSADVDAIAEAIHKVLANIEELRGLDHKAIRNQRLGRADRES